MAIYSRLILSPLAALIVVATLATAAFGLIDSSKLYTVEGYLDRAPNGATIIARLDVGTIGLPRRQLLITAYRSEARLFGDELSAAPYVVRGKLYDVDRLLRAREGSAVKGTFVIYPQAIATLVIASLDSPA